MANGAIVINRQQANESNGRDLWWEKSDTNAIKSIKNGKGRRYASLKEAISYLHS